MKHTLLFYGDSNTWGYDPASFTDGRYPDGKIWPSLLQEELGRDWEVIPRGLNGRTLPARQEDLDRISRMADGLGPDDVFGIMLGTNDIGLTSRPDAAVPAARMERLLQTLTQRETHMEKDGAESTQPSSDRAGAVSEKKPATQQTPKILVIAPPWIGGTGATDPALEPYREQCRHMNAAFARLAAKYGAFFADAAEWRIGMAFDFIHFSLAGHRQFAYHMRDIIEMPETVYTRGKDRNGQ